MQKIMMVLLLSLSLMVGAAEHFVSLGEVHELKSKHLGETHELVIQMPGSYANGVKRYPVFYVLDGKSQFLQTTSTIEFLSAKGLIPEMIVVAVTSQNRMRDYTDTVDTNWEPGGGGAKHFKAFLKDEVMSLINQQYRTQGFNVLSGFSASAQFVLYAMRTEPGLFNAYFAATPSLWWDDKQPIRALKNGFAKLRSLPAFLYVSREHALGGALNDYNALVDTLRSQNPNGLRWHAKAYDDETHTSLAMISQIDALKTLYEGWRLPIEFELFEGLGVNDVVAHYQAFSDRLHVPLLVPENALNTLGYQKLNRGQLEQAVELFRLNAEHHPHSPNAYDSLADAYQAQNDLMSAKKAIAQAVELATKQSAPNLSYYLEHQKRIDAVISQQLGPVNTK